MPTTIADVRVPPDAFPLDRVLAGFPAAEIELERVVPTAGAIVPLFWVGTGTAETVVSTLADDPRVESFERLVVTDDRALYAVEWSADADGLVTALNDSGAEVLRGRGTAERWEFRLLFPHQRQLSTFRDACEAASIPLDVVRVFHPRSPETDATLTPAQREALSMALDGGYFEVPRRVTQRELAERAGVSANAMSQRLRRGARIAVEALLSADES